MPIKRTALALVLIASLSGCAGSNSGLPYLGGADNFGEANRQTMAAQIIDPAPVYDTAIPETSAEHAAQAVKRYRTDTVKKPDRVKTSNAGASNTGSGGN